jgi:hypothetical protein
MEPQRKKTKSKPTADILTTEKQDQSQKQDRLLAQDRSEAQGPVLVLQEETVSDALSSDLMGRKGELLDLATEIR